MGRTLDPDRFAGSAQVSGGRRPETPLGGGGGGRSSPPSRSLLPRVLAPRQQPGRSQGGGTCPRGVRGAPAPCRAGSRARRAPQPRPAEPWQARAAPRPHARAPAPSPPPPRAPPLAPLPRPTSSARPRGLSPQPPPTPPPPLRLGLGAGSGRRRDSCAGEHRQAVSPLSPRVCVRVRLPPAGPAARGSGRPPAPPPPGPPGLPRRVPAAWGFGRPARLLMPPERPRSPALLAPCLSSERPSDPSSGAGSQALRSPKPYLSPHAELGHCRVSGPPCSERGEKAGARPSGSDGVRSSDRSGPRRRLVNPMAIAEIVKHHTGNV
ncbi:basic proline-rich protein-like [Mustela putorius furo]|uniref:Basic proline-rich protein-like n=1 Tax=Mustela putorius furo TaxID=9669 RepID=A0A8U0UPM6_MUSPF|nr:basic proline-rich protein-like [Mustela putorius furo]